MNGDDSDFKLVRVDTDGTLDTTFSGDGKAYVNFDLGGTNSDRALDGVQLPNGKLIIVGSAEVTGQGTDFAIAKLNVDGSRDTSFGVAGRVTLHFDLDAAFLDEIASSVAVDAAGNILVAGIAQKSSTSDADFAIARLTPNGALDPNFGGDGRVTIAFDIGGSLDDEALELIVAPDGSIFVTGIAPTTVPISPRQSCCRTAPSIRASAMAARSPYRSISAAAMPTFLTDRRRSPTASS